MRPLIITFDIDNTLVADAPEPFCAHLNIGLDHITPGEPLIATEYGTTWQNQPFASTNTLTIARTVLSARGIPEPQLHTAAQEAIRIMSRSYVAALNRHEHTETLMPDALQAVQDAFALTPHVGVCSAVPSAVGRARLAHTRLHIFSGAYGEEGPTKHETLPLAWKRTGPPEATHIHVGDSLADIEAAKTNHGIAIGITTGTTSAESLQKAGADHIISGLLHLAPWLRSKLQE